MNSSGGIAHSERPATWKVVLAFTLVYLSWGTTYLAIKEGVKTLPPALFGGSRNILAGVLLLGFLAARGDSLRLGRSEFFGLLITALLLFVGGNGLITVGERTVDSGVASVLVATTPIWMALCETLWPRGDRLTLRGWLGLLLGLGGVLVLMAPELTNARPFWGEMGFLLVMGSSVAWALGSVYQRHRRRTTPAFVSAGYQMLLGGLIMTLLGLAVGEPAELSASSFTPAAVYSFFHLLVVGSLIGFVAFNWLLGHVSTTLVGTYAYVNPVIAVLVGWLIGGEVVTPWIVLGMLVILGGVALVRSGGLRHSPQPVQTAEMPAPPEEEEAQVPLTGAQTGLTMLALDRATVARRATGPQAASTGSRPPRGGS